MLLTRIGYFALHQHTAEIFLYEIGLYDAPFDGASGIEIQQRLDILFSCLGATKSFFNAFFLLPNEVLIILPYALWAQLAYALLICSRLSLLDCNGWDLLVVRNELDLSVALGKVLDKIETAIILSRQQGVVGGRDDVMERVAYKITLIKHWFDGCAPGGQRRQDTIGQSPPLLDPMQYGAILDDSFWEELMKDPAGRL